VLTKPEEVPNCNCSGDDPEVETPTNITVIFFAVDGIPVNSTLVPEVDALAVSEVITDPKVGGASPLDIKT
jgi:hypothetical protein